MEPVPPIRSLTRTSMTDGSAAKSQVVLLITAPDDPTTDSVQGELTKRSSSVVRFDIGDFPTRMRMAVRNDSTRWRGRLVVGSDMIDLDTIRSVYYRRPSRFVLPEGLSAGDAAFATTEARLGFGGPLSSLPVLWVNHPAKVATAVQVRAVDHRCCRRAVGSADVDHQRRRGAAGVRGSDRRPSGVQDVLVVDAHRRRNGRVGLHHRRGSERGRCPTVRRNRSPDPGVDTEGIRGAGDDDRRGAIARRRYTPAPRGRVWTGAPITRP